MFKVFKKKTINTLDISENQLIKMRLIIKIIKQKTVFLNRNYNNFFLLLLIYNELLISFFNYKDVMQ